MHLQGEVRVAVKHAAAKTKEGLEEQVDNGRIKKYGGRQGGFQGRCLFGQIVCVWWRFSTEDILSAYK